METSQATQPRTGWLTWLLNTVLDIVFARVPGAELAAQHSKKPKVLSTRATKEQYDTLLKKRDALSKRMRQDEILLNKLNAKIKELEKQLNL